MRHRCCRGAAFVLLAALLWPCVSAPVASARPAAANSQTRLYHGAWFDVKYPAGFQVTPGPKSATSATGTDSASFMSPDGAAQFFVYSPQWSGPCPYAQIDRARETPVSARQQVTPSKFKGVLPADALRITWTTVRSLSGGYLRSWEDYQDGATKTRHVFGIRYKNAQALARYKAQYAAFKKSLVQFAD